MSLNSVSAYRNLLLANHVYKNEGPVRFHGYISQNGRSLEAKEVAAVQESFVHPQGVLARSALLRDVSNGNLKYGRSPIRFYSTTVTQAAAGATYTCQAPGRIIGVFVDNLVKANAQAVDVQTTMSTGSAATILSATYAIPNTGLEAYDASGNLLGHAGASYVSGSLTIGTPVAVSTVAPTIATDILTIAGGVPYAPGDVIRLSVLGTVTNVSVGVDYFVGAITATTFKIYATRAAAIAGGTDQVDLQGTASNLTVTAQATVADASPTPTATFVAETGSSISANNGKPVRITITNGGCGHVTVPSITAFPGVVGSGIITKGYISNGRLLAIDVHHACDVLPGNVISFPNAGFTATGSSARVTVAIAEFSV
jgi:hypothetical protein